MDTKPRIGIRIPQTRMPEVRSEGTKAQTVNRWLVVAVGIVTVVAIALGAALIVESGAEETATTRPPATEPAATAPTEAQPAAGFDVVGSPITAWVDGSIAVYNSGADSELFRRPPLGGSVAAGPWLYRYDDAERGFVVDGLRDAVGASHVERISPVIALTSEDRFGGRTVVFSVSAGGKQQTWIQHWANVWGQELTEMRVY